MDSNSDPRMSWKTALVSILCLGGALAGAYTFYLDLNESGRMGAGKVVGKIEKREAKVRRKSGSSYVWTNVLTSEDLFRKDSIQTGPGSAASIRLSDGSLVDLSESSLIVMDDTTNLALSFVRGSAVIHKKEGDSKISLGSDGKAKIEELPARLLKPESLARYFVSGKDRKTLTFSWDVKSSDPEPYHLEVSTERQFRSGSTWTFSPSAPNSKTYPLQLGAGKFFWRVSSESLRESEVRQLQVVSVSPIQTLFPAAEQKVQGAQSAQPAQSAQFGGAVQFRWVSPKNSNENESDVSMGDHQIEVSPDPDFKTVLQSQSLNIHGGLATLHGLPEGRLYWRVRSVYGDVRLVSVVKGFFYQNAPEVPLLSYPSFVKPENGTAFDLRDKKVPLEASWSRVPGAEAYEILLLKTSEEGNKNSNQNQVLRFRTEKTGFSFRNLEKGSYRWSLKAVDHLKRLGEALPERTFKMTTGEPLAAPEVVTPEVQ